MFGDHNVYEKDRQPRQTDTHFWTLEPWVFKGYDIFFSAREHVDGDIPNDNLAAEKNDHNIDGANYEARTTEDVQLKSTMSGKM
jgi:hypothetical protein